MRYDLLLALMFAFSRFVSVSQTNITDSIVHQNFQRKFMVHLPPDFSSDTQRPLVISLHGGSGNMVNAQGFSQLNPVSDAHDFVVAWPQGYGIAPPGFSWADGRNTSADQAGIDDVGFIDKLLDTLIARYSIDTNRVYLCGFSNGGFMTQRIACELPGRYAAMAALGASMDTLLFQTCAPIKPVPMAIFNGTADPAMPYTGGPMQNPFVTPVVPVDSTVHFWVDHNHCQTANAVLPLPDTFTTDNSTAELYTFTDCDCAAEVRFFKLINGGHTWPGVFVPAQEEVLGNTNRDIHASTELWNFFSQHTLCSTSVGIDAQALPMPISVFPNPVSQMLTISTPYSDHIRSELRNQWGQTVLTASGQYQLQLSECPSGIYFLTVHQGQTLATLKIIKQ